MKAGDLIGFLGFELVSTVINVGTYGMPLGPTAGLSHIGFLADSAPSEPGRELWLWETTTMSPIPCLVQGRCVDGTQAVRLADRLAVYNGRVWRYPLYRELYPHERRRLTEWARSRIGRPYNAAAAIKAAGLCGALSIAYTTIFGDDRLDDFCSDETADALSQIGVAPTSDPARFSPNSLVRHLRYRGILLRRERLK